VLVGWDTLDVPTYRHRAFAAYQSGRQFDRELRDQLDVLPHFVAACGFVCAKSPGYEADDFLAAAVAGEELRGGMAIVATGDRDAFQLASELTTILQPVRAAMDKFAPLPSLQDQTPTWPKASALASSHPRGAAHHEGGRAAGQGDRRHAETTRHL
jgi:hypothetical protein